MKFRVDVSNRSDFVYVVEADSVDDAIEAALSGDHEPVRENYWDDEVTSIRKVED